jgi:hypothetical protein
VAGGREGIFTDRSHSEIATSWRRWRNRPPTAVPQHRRLQCPTLLSLTAAPIGSMTLNCRTAFQGFWWGWALSKFKQIGVWDKFPQALKDKARAAKGRWAGLKITQRDLDSIPDDAWEKTAVVLGVKWKYATASRGCGRGFATAVVQSEPGSILAGVAP